jgi:hypothetical protein
MSFYTRANFAKSTLSGNITDSATSLAVASGAGAKFPSAGTFICVIWGAAYASPDLDANAEIIEVTARSTDTFTIVRGRESTAGYAWSSGDKIACTITAGTLNQLNTPVDLTSASSDYLLGVGETAFLNYTAATSIPLHVQTQEGEYELSIIGSDFSVTPVNDNSTLLPNGTTYSNAFSRWILRGTGITVSASADTISSFYFSYGRTQRSTVKISTVTTGKHINSIGAFKSTTANYTDNENVLWNDTTTAWTSLGTITLAVAQTGKIVIKRII